MRKTRKRFRKKGGNSPTANGWTDLNDIELDVNPYWRNLNNDFSSDTINNHVFNDKNELILAIAMYTNNRDKATDWYGPIRDWDVSRITDMSELFFKNITFDGDISNWNVSNVTTMNKMFLDAAAFNQSIGNWNVSKVTDMTAMFFRATAFNQPIADWNVSNVTDMKLMFHGAVAFNQPIGEWDVSNVTNMAGMFNGAVAFNQPIGEWDVSNVTNMEIMFKEAIAFNQPIGIWNVSNVTNMTGMFNGATVFNQPIGNWNVSKVTDMTAMFFRATAFNQPIANWNVSNVTNMEMMFKEATVFNQPIGNWDVSNVTNMAGMFNGATAFNQPIGEWDVSNVTSMEIMFKEATAFNQPIGNWNVSKVQIMDYMFEGATEFNQIIDYWKIGNIRTMKGMFKNATKFYQIADNFQNAHELMSHEHPDDKNIFSGTKFNECEELIIEIMSKIRELSKHSKFLLEGTNAIRNDLEPMINNYIRNGCKMVILFHAIFDAEGLFNTQVIKYLVTKLTPEDKEETYGTQTILDSYLSVPYDTIRRHKDPDLSIYNALKPSGYESTSPASYAESERGTVTKKETRSEFPDYEILISTHGQLSNTINETIDFPFRKLKHLVCKGNILMTRATFTDEMILYSDTYEDTRLQNNQIIMESMVLNTNSNNKLDNNQGIFIRKPGGKFIKLFGVQSKGKFQFINNEMKPCFDIDGGIMTTTLKRVIECLVRLLSNTKHSKKILKVDNFDFNKCDIIIYACRGFKNAPLEKEQYVKISHRPRQNTSHKKNTRKRRREESESESELESNKPSSPKKTKKSESSKPKNSEQSISSLSSAVSTL